MSEENPTPQGIPVVGVIIVYGLMAALAYGLGFWISDRNVFLWEDIESNTTLPIDVAIGAVAGLIVVALSRVLDKLFTWARALADNLKTILGELTHGRILTLAVCSSLAEEMLFRGLLQPEIGIHWSSLIFGLLHKGPDRSYLPWTIMAIAMGYAFAGMYLYTGNLLAPILAHFTINYFNLHALAAREVPQAPAATGEA